MAAYDPPLRDLDFILHDVLAVQESPVPGFADLDRDFTAAILGEAGRIARDVLAPLNAIGDREGCRLENGVVRTPEGFKAAYDLIAAGGWIGLDLDPDYGGQGMPHLLNTAVGEMHAGANMAHNMNWGLTHGAYNALHAHASEEQ
jgi:alkylation response protein AidB-like acyl-CoA dehydrogenase